MVFTEASMEISKRRRLDEVYRRLKTAPDAASADEAFRQMSNVINEVEDQLTPTPYNPADWRSDGRIYPPQADNVHPVPEHPHVSRFRASKHNVFIGANGAIEIQATDGSKEFEKAGADGRYVWNLN
jgi:hypothetical protein